MISAGLLAVAVSSIAQAAEPALETLSQRYSYTVGYQLGQRLATQETELDPAAFAAAVQDALGGVDARLSMEDRRKTMTEWSAAQQAAAAEAAQANLESGQSFLADNAKREGVTVLPSGLQYEVLSSGEGKTPAADQTVVVHYEGTLIDGTVFDSSRKRGAPATFSLAGVIDGFKEALTHMKEGDHWKVFIPSELGYGARGAGQSIGPNSALIFDLELLEVKS
ncbi:MAG: FKBP-type peptidyl-prolyl cis-trans isomerase [Chromatiales bacterium]|nr:FKBP-type peptidyl-prolyl cis-trans isomerase [Chromatiales bacterium]